MVQEALKKLQAEITSSKDPAIDAIGSYIMNYVRSNPEHADLFLAEKKNLAGGCQACYEEARKKAQNNRAMMSGEEVFRIVLKYYGVPVPEEKQAAVEAPTKPKITTTLDDIL